MRSALIFIIAVLFAPLGAQETSAGPAPAYSPKVPKPTQSGIPYGTHERQVMDFWKAESTAPTPLVFVIHGGGWTGGSKERVDRAVDVEALLKVGISVVAINYRLIKRGAPGSEPPVKAPLHDAARAAGGCSSLWLAFHDDLADPKSDDPVARESTRLSCAAVTAPQTSLDPAQMKSWTPNSTYGGHAFGFANFAEFLAGREKILPLIAEYSPYALVSADDPGVYMTFRAAPAIGQNLKDSTHTSNFGVKLAEHCGAKGVPAELVYPGAPNVVHATPTDYLIATLTYQGMKRP